VHAVELGRVVEKAAARDLLVKFPLDRGNWNLFEERADTKSAGAAVRLNCIFEGPFRQLKSYLERSPTSSPSMPI